MAYCNGRFIIMATLRLNADGKRDNNVMRRQVVVSSDRPEGPSGQRSPVPGQTGIKSPVTRVQSSEIGTRFIPGLITM